MTQNRSAPRAGILSWLGVLALVLALADCGPRKASDTASPDIPDSAEASQASKPSGAAEATSKAQIPAGEADALAALNTSPRHGEMVDVPQPGGGPPIRTWIVYPERAQKAGVVLVIHEIYGLSDWIRGLTDGLAREGYIGVAPDLVSGMGPGGGGTDSAATRDDVVQMVRGLTPQETASRIATVRDYALKLSAANGKYATIGFCWGGARSFEQAAVTPAPTVSLVFYGATPDSATVLKVTAPVVGFYGGDDARVNSTIPRAQAALKQYTPHVYDGAGHGFMRAQADREGANLSAAQKAWPEAMNALKRRLE